MKLITVTSDNYVGHTRLMLESLRVFHADLPVVVYALERGWTPAHAGPLTELGATVAPLGERDASNRSKETQLTGMHAVFKLDAMCQQAMPFVFVDGDALVLRPLDDLFDRVRRDGWVSSNDDSPLRQYCEGPVMELVDVPESARSQFAFNSGVIGCDPVGHPDMRRVFDTAKEWSLKLASIRCGDQGLLNLAWVKCFGRVPPHAGFRFNAGFNRERFDAGCTILHLHGFPTWDGERDKLAIHRRIWDAWPRGVRLVNLDETEFWRRSLPHPWPWLNQCNQSKHRAFVAKMRRDSETLLEPSWLLVRDEFEAYLLGERVLAAARKFWEQHAARFVNVPMSQTYLLDRGGVVRPRWGGGMSRIKAELRRMMPI